MDGWDVIHRVTRAELLANGDLVEVPQDLARQAGWTVPMAICRGAWAETVAWTPEDGQHSGQSETGRLWDVLFVAMVHARARKETDRFVFPIYVVERRTARTVKHVLMCVCGPDDVGNPCVTIGFPEEI